jgi:RimJ/RimL family protein N-acetyltransferase
LISDREYFLRTARLGFSLWRADDLPLAKTLWGDARVTSLIGGPFSPDAIAERLQKEISTASECGVQYWPLFLLDSGDHAGCGGLRPYRPEEKVFEVGFHLRPECWGKGLAAEAANGIIKFAFEELDAHALFAGHHPANVGSKRVLEKLGFRFSHSEFYPPTGLQHPSYILDRPKSSSK